MNTPPTASCVVMKPATNEVEKGQLSQKRLVPAKAVGVHGDGVVNRRNSQQTKFALILVANLLAVGALLLLWNSNALTDKNITVAAVIIAGMIAMSALCCASLLIAARCSPTNKMELVRSGPNFGRERKLGRTFKQHRQRLMLRAGIRKKHGGPFTIQTVCPTPEFQYYPHSTMQQPCGNERAMSQSESQLSTGAFSLLSTLPASSLDSQLSGFHNNGGAGVGFVLNNVKFPYASDSSPRSTSSTSASEMHHLMLPTPTCVGYSAAQHCQLRTNSALRPRPISSCLSTTPDNGHVAAGVFMHPPRMYSLV